MSEEKKKKVTLSKYQKSNKKLKERLATFVKHDKTSNEILDALNHGENKYLRSHRIETTNYDPKWLTMIEDCIPELGEIIKNPRKVTQTVTDIVPVELAKKTNAESVRHLASHTQYVKSVDEYGNVTPNKVLNIGTDDNYFIYENKFIATLVKRLVVFVEKRYEFLTKYVPLKETDVLMYKTRSIVDGSIVEIETKVKITKNAEDDVKGGSTTAYIKRIERVRNYILYYLGSDFMKMFKNEKDVTGQILQTNIIRKNKNYHKCYLLYRYITGYNQLGIDYKVKEEYVAYTENQMKEINNLGLSAFLATDHNGPSHLALEKQKKYKPRILTSIDDEPFVYGPVINKPIQYIRCDEQYFLDQEKSLNEIKLRPTKEEAEYQKEDAEKKKKLEEEKKRVAALKKRREQELKEFKKKREAMREEKRKQAEAERIRKEEERKKKELERIEKARKDLKEQAVVHRKEDEQKAKEEKALEKARQKLLQQQEEEQEQQENTTPTEPEPGNE